MSSAVNARRRRSASFWCVPAFVALAVTFYILCFVHLRADFPSHSHWDDRAKITDEGWYSGAAVEYFSRGQWRTPDALNTAAAFPVWPVLTAAAYRIAGPGIVTSRTLTLLLYGCSAALLYLLLWRERRGMAAAAAVAMVMVNPFCYAFDRLSILEPVLVFWMMLGLWLAAHTGRADTLKQVLLGCIIALLALTKGTGVCVVPALLYFQWAHAGRPRRGWLRMAVIPLAVSAVLFGGYYLLIIRLGYYPDCRMLFVTYHDRIHAHIAIPMAFAVARTAWNAMPFLTGLGAAALLAAAVSLRQLWKRPMFTASVITVVTYLAFVWYYTNLQPRYFLVIAMPLAAMIVLAAQALWERSHSAAVATSLVLLCAAAPMLAVTLRFVLHPEYSFAGAANDIARIVRSGPSATPVVFAASGDDITMFSGLPTINDGFSAHGLNALAQRYHPTWLAAWTDFERKTIAQLSQQYTLVPVAHYMVFDYGAGNQLVLYRLEPRSTLASTFSRPPHTFRRAAGLWYNKLVHAFHYDRSPRSL